MTSSDSLPEFYKTSNQSITPIVVRRANQLAEDWTEGEILSTVVIQINKPFSTNSLQIEAPLFNLMSFYKKR